MSPLADLIRHLAHDIQASGASAAPIHSAVPSHAFVPRFSGIIEARRSLEKNPAGPVGESGRNAVVDRALPAIDLVARWIEPGFHGEGLGVFRIHGRVVGDHSVPGDLGPGGVIEKLRTIAVTYKRAGEWVYYPGSIGTCFEDHQIVDGISRRSQAADVYVDERPAGVVIEPIVRLRPIAEDRGLIIGPTRSDHQYQQCQRS